MKSWVIKAIPIVMALIKKNVGHHPHVSEFLVRDVVAITAPKLPKAIRKPIIMENSLDLNHWEIAISVGTYTPSTTSPMMALQVDDQ